MENGGQMVTEVGGGAYVTGRGHDDASCQSPVVQAVEDLAREFRCSIWWVELLLLLLQEVVVNDRCQRMRLLGFQSDGIC